MIAACLLTTGCPRMPQGNPRSTSGNGDTKETPVPATAPNSRADQAGGTANRPENFGDITNPKSPTKTIPLSGAIVSVRKTSASYLRGECDGITFSNRD